jgi:DNA-binding PadR family transcriptional regulator
MNTEALKGHLDLLLLSVLRARPAHGYAIIEELSRRSGGTFDLPEGTVYPALHRLERAGLLSSRWSDETGRKRRIYEITKHGLQALGAYQSDWQRFAEGINTVLREANGPWPA